MADLGNRTNVDTAINTLLDDAQPNEAIQPSDHNGLLKDILDTLANGLFTVLRTGSSTGGENIFFNGTSYPIYQRGSFQASLDVGTLTGNQSYTLPDNTGTIALLSDITGGNTIYNSDDSLTGNRILDLDGNSLSFNNQAGDTIISLLDNGAFTLGQGATTANLSSVAIGFNAEATNANSSIAIGTGSDAKGNYDIAIGYNSSAETNDGIAIGNGAKILTGGFGVAIGKNAESTSGGGMSMGVNTKAGTLALALGYVAQATGTYAVSLGYSNLASGVNSIAIGGRGNAVSGARSVLISTNNSSQTNSVAQTFVVNLNDTTNALYIGQNVDSYYGGSGNFGFGTTTPSSKLTVQGNGTTTGSTFSLYDNDTIPNKTFEVLDNGQVRFLNLPTSSAGLSSGDIWNDGGTLKIV